MYYKQYYTYDTVYRPYYPVYVIYEIPREKNILCSLAEALCGCVAFTITAISSIFICSTGLLLRSCDNKEY
ncbi:conserved Plasmodium protein, unknown function [Plasmodium malariae]|uniref:Uncharacterized protein n=1 Tax=Plasmodium malariae TaxID=5858 RepID=A0A1C3KDY5_PLAMA|nr:conserved Plasmodium protein, unknown function [Plasmodium malariae]